MPTVKRELDLSANHNAELISIAITFNILSMLCVISRLFSRKMCKHKITVDDILLVAAWVVGVGHSVTFTAAIRFGKIGYHQVSLQPHHVVALQKAFYASSFLHLTALALSKISLLIMLHRIFKVVRGFQIACWVFGGIVCAWWVAALFAGAFICYPAQEIWKANDKDKCGNMAVANIITSIPWVLTDIAILIAPMPVVRKLQLDRAKKFRVYCAFLVGGMTCVVSIIRYRSIFIPGDDFSWSIVAPAYWSLIEIHVTIMCPALMVSMPFLTYIGCTIQSWRASLLPDLSLPCVKERWRPTSTAITGRSSAGSFIELKTIGTPIGRSQDEMRI